MAKLTAQQQSLVNRIALAVVRVEEARAAMAALLNEPGLTSNQKRAVEKQVGHLDGLGESLDRMRP